MTTIRLRYLLRPREVTDRTNLQVLSVYRDYGIIPKGSRSDNFNKTPEDITRYQEVRVGDLVVNKMKAWQGSAGISAHHGIVSPDYLVCSVDTSVNSRFMHHLLRSAPLAAAFGARSKGIRPAQWRLYWEDLAEIPINLPVLDEQRRIADFLDVETARIDGLQRARDRQIEVLNELVASKISALVPTREDASFVRIGYLAVIQSGVTVDGKRDSGSEAVTLPYLRVANVQDGRLDLASITEITVPSAVAQSSMLRFGDVLMTEGGDLDKLGRGTVWNAEIERCLHQNHVFAVRPDQGKLMPEYLALITRTVHARAYFESTGTKTTNLASTSTSKIRDFRIPLIALPDQARVVRETDSWLEEIAKVKAVLTVQRTLLAERRQALITAAVTGGITV
jgi:type I restriction enzyme, S subunit